jgi:predicted N-acetyltransferase YhbS
MSDHGAILDRLAENAKSEAVRVELLADHPSYLETIARWHAEEDGGGLDFWRRQLRSECGRERIPLAFVALDGGRPLGHVSLVEQNLSSHPELSPWLAGTLVEPSRRGQGVGKALVRHATAHAADLGVETLYLYTQRARGFYERLGWRHLWDEEHEGEPVSVLAIDLP